MLRQWAVLTLAVSNQWGGSDSDEKAGMLFDEILEQFLHPKEGKLYKDVRFVQFSYLCAAKQCLEMY